MFNSQFNININIYTYITLLHLPFHPKPPILNFQDDGPLQSLTRTKTSVTTDFQFSRCTIQQLSNTFHYDYEYLGPYNRLVQTPLTDRAFLSLTQALKNFHCGTLIGPPGVGKSETVKDLAKVLVYAFI